MILAQKMIKCQIGFYLFPLFFSLVGMFLSKGAIMIPIAAFSSSYFLRWIRRVTCR